MQYKQEKKPLNIRTMALDRGKNKNYVEMKKLEFPQMEILLAGKETDCSLNERLVRIAVAAGVGTIGGPFGFIAGMYAGFAYDAYACGWK